MADTLAALIRRIRMPLVTLEHLQIAATDPTVVAERKERMSARLADVTGLLIHVIDELCGPKLDQATREHIAGRGLAGAVLVKATPEEFAAVFASIETAA